jgi:DNA repair photolyase
VEYDVTEPDADFPEPSPATECRPENAKSIIARNRSPDIPFYQSINPYRGCEHGCVYCFARPTHAYLDLSPGLDFETRLTWKPNAATLLEAELRKPGYACSPIAMGTNTDPYQPVEKRYRLTRQVLEVLQRFRHPVSITTKGALVLRDIDLLAEMARDRLASVAISVTTLDRDLKRALEPRTPDGEVRLKTMEKLAGAGIPVSLLLAPVIPALNDCEIETILQRAVDAGAVNAAYILLRLPLEVAPLFEEWLHTHYPLRAEHVMSLVRQCRDGKANDARFGHRMRGNGQFADLLSARFRIARKRLGLELRDYDAFLDCSQFSVPAAAGDQLSLI